MPFRVARVCREVAWMKLGEAGSARVNVRQCVVVDELI